MSLRKDFKLTIPDILKKDTVRDAEKRFLIVGFDGISFTIIHPLIKAGKLSNIRKLMDSGAWGVLDCPPPYRSSSGWTSFMTGTNAAKHGIFSFEIPKPGTHNFVSSDSRMCANKTFWNILGEQRKKVVIVNSVATYPPEQVNGIMICGTPIPQDANSYTYPEHLTSELSAIGYSHTADLDEHGMCNNMEDVCQLSEYLLKNTDWDLFFTTFIVSDRFQHMFASNPAKINDFYERMDKVLGRLLSLCDEKTTVIVCSDHGLADFKRCFRLKSWLYKEGYLSIKESHNHHNIFDTFLSFFNKKAKADQREDKKKADLRSIDWENTRAYTARADIFASCAPVRINEDVFCSSDGTNYEKFRLHLKEKLSDVRDPATGGKIFESVFLREEIFNGKLMKRIPDIVGLLKEGYSCDRDTASVEKVKDSAVVTDLNPSKRLHYKSGVFIIKGPNIKKHIDIKPSIMDIAPTVLYLYGANVPTYMDGQVLTDIIAEDYLKSKPVEFVEEDGYRPGSLEYSFDKAKEIDKTIEDDLRKLGYIE